MSRLHPEFDADDRTHKNGCAAYSHKAFLPDLCDCGLGHATDRLPDDPPSGASDFETFLCEMSELTSEASPDELRVLLAIARRLNVGRKQYGALNVATDRRDFVQEQHEELLDAAVYGAILTLGKP